MSDECPLCGFKSKEPLGVAADDSKKGEHVNVVLNNNGLKALHCPKNHLKLNPGELLRG